jgi:hypothetical protein
VNVRIACRSSYRGDSRGVRILRPVRCIQSKNVYSSGEQLTQNTGRICGRP